MTARLNYYAAAPTLLKQFLDLNQAVLDSGLERSLLELVKIRASQLNRCANCLNMHTAEARALGETEQRIHLLAAWEEAPVYSDRERAALAWTDHLTLIAEKGAPDDVHAALAAQFSKEEQVRLTMMIVLINGWNRIAIGFRAYDPKLGWEGRA